jgi:hypothetical protein
MPAFIGTYESRDFADFKRMKTWAPKLLVKASPLVLLCLHPQAANTQLNAGAAVSLVARLPGTVTLHDSVIPFVIEVAGTQQRTSHLKFDVSWNLDPKETESFRVIANSTMPNPSGRLMIRVDDSDFRYFSSNSRAVLFNVPIRQENRQGRQTHTLELLFDTTETSLPEGEYRGSLALMVERH